jgi:hypothetical protein
MAFRLLAANFSSTSRAIDLGAVEVTNAGRLLDCGGFPGLIAGEEGAASGANCTG